MTEHQSVAPAQVALLVVGGGPAALAAARSYRDHDGTGPVLLVSDDDALPYLRPPLSKEWLRGEMDETELGIEPASFYADHEITARLGLTVTDLDAEERRVVVSDGTEVGFDHCVLATGSTPAPLPVPGADHPAVLSLRSLDSARRLREASTASRSVVVVGSGFIGCEAAVSLARLGLEVTVCSRERHPQEKRLGGDAAQRLAGWLHEEGVRLVGPAEAAGVEEGRTVHLEDGASLRADLVLVAAGAVPNSSLAATAGLEIDQGRIVVDEQMRASAPAVFAAGDVALARHAAAGRHLVVEHWGEAETMGRIAGTTAAGGTVEWSDPPGFWTVIGDRTLKYVAWGDGFDSEVLVDHDNGGFTVWYHRAGVLVGVAAHDADDDYERGAELVREAALEQR